MLADYKERKELPTQVLFHGTTVGQFIRYFATDGSYQDPDGGPIWLDENTNYSLSLAQDYQTQHSSDAMLVIARTDMLSLQKPPNAIRTSSSQLLIPHFWTARRLPPGSFVSYNITQDPDRLFTNTTVDHHMSGMEKLCKPLGVLPDYVKLFMKK